MMRNVIMVLIGLLFCKGNLKASDWSFLSVADTRGGNGLQVALQWASANLTTPAPLFLIHAGDLEPFTEVDKLVTSYFGKPFFPSMGNHDKDIDRQNFYDSYYIGKKLPYLIDSTLIEEEGMEALIYSFVYQNVYFIMLDQYSHVPYRNYGEVTGRQLEWLEGQLRDNRYPYIFVIGHEPAYPQSWQNNYGDCLDRNPEERDRFWAILSQYQVTAYLCGHTHSYLKQYIGDVWHINLALCVETDDHNSMANFIVTDDSILVQLYLLDGKLHDQFSLMKRNIANPVELGRFSYELKDGRVSLNWHTVAESNNYGFEIQKSRDKINFNKIGFVPGQGTTQQPQQYEFNDRLLETGKFYYRLKQIDFDGAFEYSNWIEVPVNQATDFQLPQNSPNPFNQSTTISYKIDQDAEVTLEIYNIKGQWLETLVNEYQTAGIYQINWTGKNPQGNSLPSGIYLGRLRCNNKTTTIKMLLSR